MGTIISQILICLIVAALIGALIGWLLRAISASNWLNSREQEWQANLRQHEQDLAKARGQITSHLSELEVVKKDLALQSDKVKVLQGTSSDYQSKADSLANELAAKANAFHALQNDISALRSQLAEAHSAMESQAASIQSQESANKSLLSRYGSLEAEHLSQTARLGAAESDAVKLRKQLSDALAVQKANVDEAKRFQDQMENLRREHAGAKAEALNLTHKLKEIEALRMQLADTNNLLAARSQELQAATEQNRKAQDERNLANHQIDVQRQTIESHEANLGAQAAKILLLSSDLASQARANAEIESAGKTLRTQLAEAQSDAQKSAGKDAELEDLRHQIRERNDKMKLLHAGAFSRNAAGAEELENLRRRLAERDDRIKSREAEIASHAGERAAMTTELDKLRAALAQNQSELRARIDELAQIETEMGPYKQRLAMREAEVGKLTAQLRGHEALREQLNQRDEELGRLRTRAAEIDGLRLQVGAAQTRTGDAEARLVSAVREKEAALDRLRSRSNESDSLQKQLSEVKAKLHDTAMRHQAEVRIKDEEIARLQREAAVAPALGEEKDDHLSATRAITPRIPAGRDDLKLIFGIGPVLEKTLNKMGIFHFRQIASWSAADIQRIDALLVNFRGRIKRDNWVRGARDAHFKKYRQRV
ncbi:MAG: hypothetical protein WCB36_07065 [Burkholderiales bacterium]